MILVWFGLFWFGLDFFGFLGTFEDKYASKIIQNFGSLFHMIAGTDFLSVLRFILFSETTHSSDSKPE